MEWSIQCNRTTLFKVYICIYVYMYIYVRSLISKLFKDTFDSRHAFLINIICKWHFSNEIEIACSESCKVKKARRDNDILYYQLFIVISYQIADVR